MIPARLQASRFPGKLLKHLDGKTVILRTYEAAVETGFFEEVYVVTDSTEIADEIKRHDGNVIMSQTEHDCGSDRIAEAVQQVECDLVVNVQGDEPFIRKESLRKVLDVFKGKDAGQIDLASLMVPIEKEAEINDPNTVKVVVDQSDFALYFSRAPIPYKRDNTGLPTFKHKGIYAFRKGALLDFYALPMTPVEAVEKIECLRYLENGHTIKMAKTSVETIEIDTPEDLEAARELLAQMKSDQN